MDVINDLANIKCWIVNVQSMARGRFDDCFIMLRADGGLNVSAEQGNDPILILCGYSAGRLASLALYRTRLTGRHALLHDQMIAAEEPAAQGAQTPTNRGRFAATCRTLEFEWNGEHLSALQEHSPEPVDDVSCLPRQDIKGAPELWTL